MARRIQIVLVVLLTIPGLIARHGSLVEHEHDGGADAHDHHALAGHVHHSHPHGGEASDDDATSDESPDEDGAPDDGDRHGHYPSAQVDAIRRPTLDDDVAARHSLSLAGATSVFLEPDRRSFGPAPSPGDRRGHPPSLKGRTTHRLIQGIGLLL